MVRDRVIKMRNFAKKKKSQETTDDIDKLIKEQMERIETMQTALKKVLKGLNYTENSGSDNISDK